MPRMMLMACLLSRVLIWPSLSWALGLGEIHLNSALNEPMNAEIDLHRGDPRRIDCVAGDPCRPRRVHALRHRPVRRSCHPLTFKVGKSKDGRDVLLVRSTDAIPEPFVTFLVEVNWARGRLMREYTVLLDPPVYTPGENRELRGAPVTAPPAVARPRRQPRHAARTAPARRGNRPHLPGASRRARRIRLPSQAAAPAASAAAPHTAARRSGVSSAGTIHVAKGDTLTKIARSLHADTRGGHRSNHDRSVPRESRGVRRQYQYFAPGRGAARSRRRRYRRSESKRGDGRSAPPNGCLAQRRRRGRGDQRPSASGDAERRRAAAQPVMRERRHAAKCAKRRRSRIGSRIWKVSSPNRSA